VNGRHADSPRYCGLQSPDRRTGRGIGREGREGWKEGGREGGRVGERLGRSRDILWEGGMNEGMRER
jgi:hypothetical protein